MRYLLGLALTTTLAIPAEADGWEGRKVFLETAQGERTHVATLAGPEHGYRMALNEEVFSDHFLSMRPFKCLESPEKHWCYVPYPYEISRKVSADDLTDLEYDLLFVWKGATEYGINLWNGVYYRPPSFG